MNSTAADSISVITTRLPYTDRRALSQAWFSALHLATEAPHAPEARARAAGPPAGATAAHAGAPSSRSSVSDPASAPARDAARRPRAMIESAPRTVAAERARMTRGTFARARSYAPFRTSLTLGLEGERVALLLRREGDTLHVVALCRPAVAEHVRRALTCADAHLRAQGERVRARVETIEGVA